MDHRHSDCSKYFLPLQAYFNDRAYNLLLIHVFVANYIQKSQIWTMVGIYWSRMEDKGPSLEIICVHMCPQIIGRFVWMISGSHPFQLHGHQLERLQHLKLSCRWTCPPLLLGSRGAVGLFSRSRSPATHYLDFGISGPPFQQHVRAPEDSKMRFHEAMECPCTMMSVSRVTDSSAAMRNSLGVRQFLQWRANSRGKPMI